MNIKSTFLAVVLSLMAASASATFIKGTIGFTGSVGGWDDATSSYTPNFLDADRLDFANVYTAAFNPFIPSNTGTFAGLNSIAVNMGSITYNPFYSVVNPLWSFTSGANTYSFSLETLNFIAPTTESFLGLKGKGTLSATGYQDTKGYWAFTSQSGLTFSAGTSVPEPGTLALLGLGLAGLGFARRKQAQA